MTPQQSQRPWLFIVLILPLYLVVFSTIGKLWIEFQVLRIQMTITEDSEKEVLPVSTFESLMASAAPSPPKAFDVDYLPDHIEVHIEDYFYRGHHVLCDDLAVYNRTSSKPIRVRYQLNCQGLFDQSDFGTGNWLLFLYNVRRVIYLLGDIDLEVTCFDAIEKQRDLILPWIMGSWKSRSSPNLDWETSCTPVWELDGTILEDLRYELQRMAVSLVGWPHDKESRHPFEVDLAREEMLQLSYQPSPLLPHVELDDVAIHFRCGDILDRAPHPNYGYARFQSLAALIISEPITSIGIVTQPFRGGQTRGQDEPQNQGRCEILVGALVSFLTKKFPHAIVTVRNDPDETIALAYARFILSKIAIAAGTSTFVTMPFRAAFGAAYEIAREDMIDSVRVFNLWQEENGREQILNLLTCTDDSL